MKEEKRKLIAAGIVVALSCCVWGNVLAQKSVESVSNDDHQSIVDTTVEFSDKTIQVPKYKNQTSIYVKAQGQVNVTADIIQFKGLRTPALKEDGTSDYAGQEYTAGWLDGNGTINLTAKELYVGSVSDGNGTGDDGFQMKNANNHLNIIADKIVSYTGDGFVNAQGSDTDPGSSTVNIGTEEHRVEHFEAHTTWGKQDYGVAILQANEGNTVNLYADTAILDGSANKKGGVIGTGGYGTVNVNAKYLTIGGNICGAYGGRNDPSKTASLNIVTDTLKMTGDINVGSAGMQNSNFSRNTEVNITANQSAVIDGNINIAGNTSNNNNSKDSSILNITFNGDSKITGDINVTGSDTDKTTQDVTVNLGGTGNMTASKGVYHVDNNANVNFTGGQWAINEWNTAAGKSAGNAAIKSEAVVDVNGAAMKVGNLEISGLLNLNTKDGKTADISTVVLKGNNGIVTTDSLNNKIKAASSQATGITVHGSGAVSDQIAADNSNIQKLASVVSNNDGESLASQIQTDAGVIAGEYFAQVDENGRVINEVKQQNKTNLSISNMAAISLMTWRQENNDMNKRLGEIRDSKGEQGVWARMARGQAKYGAQGVKNQYNYYQLGYDSKISDNWILGGAFTYTDGESSLVGGTGTNKHTGFAIYGSNLRDDGSFIDIIAKYAHMKNDFDVIGGIGKGDYSTNGLAFSAEYGKRFQKENFWIEPQAELTYGTVSSADFMTKNGASVHQDSVDSLVGRLGFALGKNIKRGNMVSSCVLFV